MHRVFRKHDYWIFINHYLPEKKRCLTKRIFSMLWSPLLGRCINQLHLKNTTLRKQDASKMHFRYFNFHISCYYLLPSFYKYLYIDFDWISIRTFFPSERIRVEDEGSWSKVINCFSRSMIRPGETWTVCLTMRRIRTRDLMNTEHENSIYTFLNMNDTEHRPWMVLPSGDLGHESGRSKLKLSSYQWLFFVGLLIPLKFKSSIRTAIWISKLQRYRNFIWQAIILKYL